jgi:hypothetical protein
VFFFKKNSKTPFEKGDKSTCLGSGYPQKKLFFDKKALIIFSLKSNSYKNFRGMPIRVIF